MTSRRMLAPAVIVPVLSLLALLAIDPSAVEVPDRSPSETLLTRSTLVCPGLRAPTAITTSTEERGPVAVRAARGQGTVQVRPDRLRRTSLGTGSGAPVVVTARDALAPGLVVGRFPAGATAAPRCRAPEPDQWYTGLTANARRASVVELTNPDRGTAVVDVVLRGPRGELDVPALRGVAVPGRRTLRFDLGEVVPRRGDLAARVTATRGRVASAVRDRSGLFAGGSSRVLEWLPAQREPTSSGLVLGGLRGAGSRELVLTNPGAGQARVALEVVTEESVFSPAGAEDVAVPAAGTRGVDLREVLGEAALRDAVGLRLAASRPVTATVRSVSGGDTALATIGAPLAEATTATVLPAAGSARILLAGAAASGSATVRARDARGELLTTERLDLVPERGRVLDLPRGTRLLSVRLRGTGAVGSVQLGGGSGVAVVGLHDLERTGLVGDVAPVRRGR